MNLPQLHTKNVSLPMKSFYILYLVLFSFIFAGVAHTQNRQIKNGDKFYEQMIYPSAAREYERGLVKGLDLRAMERVADCYVQLSNTQKAERWYGEVVKMKGAAPINKYRYGQMLKTNGKYAEARNWFEAYLQTGENPVLGARMIEACDFAVEAMKDSLRYKVTPEPCNSPGSEFGPLIFKQGYILAGEHMSSARKVTNLRNNNGFYDLYYAERNPKSKSGVTVKRLKGPINRKYHEGPASLNRDQSKLYFTRSQYVKSTKGKAAINHSKLRVFVAEYINGKWRNIEPMPFNSDNYSCGHPALSHDGNTLIFSSDIPGGFGGTDLYFCRREGDFWTTPQNLGSNVNTEGDEEFPYLHSSGSLFFASTGQKGLGGFDIFAAPKDGEKWGKPVNAGYGINTRYDDFSIAWLPGKAMGYFASNRSGSDDIFMFKRQMNINGVIVEKRTGLPLQGVAVTVLDASNQETKYITDAKGAFSHVAEWGKEYLIKADKKAFLQLRERIATADVGPMDDINRQLVMENDLILSVSGKVTDANTKLALEGATIRIVANDERSIASDGQGNYYSEVNADREYAVIVRKAGFIPQVFYFSTEGKKVSEDFKFNAQMLPGAAVLVQGRTIESESQTPIAGVNVRAIAMVNQQEASAAISRKDGRFWEIIVDPKTDPTLIASKIGYFASRYELPALDSATRDTLLDITIGMVPYEVGALVKNIYYDYNKSDIKRLASKELLEIVYFLQDNPEASVELSSYTDSRGGDKYNQDLSQRRADAAVAYVTSKGISPTRIAAKGYGESNLLNKCKDNIECTDEEHSLNRRTEIRITRVDPGNNPR
jgi:outer membrane protein OmpA-like peptidoglycan-associated protein